MQEAQGLLQETTTFAVLDERAVDALLETASEVRRSPGEIIFEEDAPGDALYLILEGDVQIFRTRPSGEVVLARLSTGETFGELALLPGRSGRRMANARALTAVRLCRIEKEAFQRQLAADHPLKEKVLAVVDRQVVENLATESRLFRALRVGPQALEEVSRAKGDTIFRQGDPADVLYLILAGTVAIYRERGAERDLLATLEEGQCFGELGFLQKAPRAATAEVASDCRLLRVPFARYEEGRAQAPELAELFGTLRRAYKLPRRGHLVQSTGKFGGREAITSLYELDDGRKVVTSRVVGQDLTNADEVSASDATPRAVTFVDEAAQVRRELRLSDQDLLVGFTVQGPWSALSELQRRLLDRIPLPSQLLETFPTDGNIAFGANAAPDSIICSCLNIERQQVTAAINEGSTSLELLQQNIGCGTACGSCVPGIQQMLGNEQWSPVRVIDERQVTSEIRRFRLRPIGRTVDEFKPGQHVVLSGLARGDWLERAYTLTSAGKEKEHYEVVVKREPRGLFSSWLFDEAGEDAMLRMSAPRGDYYWQPTGTPVVCLTAGIGVTPALAILRSRQREGWKEPLHLDCSVRQEAERVGVEEFQAASAADPTVTARWRVTTTEGRLSRAEVEDLNKKFAGAEYFLCGPIPYMNAVSELLRDVGVKPERVRIETFASAAEQPPKKASAPPAAVVPAKPESKKALRGLLGSLFGKRK